MNKETFKDIRLYLKKTQTQFAELLGISLASIAMIESGQRPISDNIRGKLAHKFTLTDDFLEYQDNKNKLRG